jgi:hypothetical protein
MAVDDMYERDLDEVTLTDRSGEAPLLIEGNHSGGVFIEDLPPGRSELGEGISEDVAVERATGIAMPGSTGGDRWISPGTAGSFWAPRPRLQV